MVSERAGPPDSIEGGSGDSGISRESSNGARDGEDSCEPEVAAGTLLLTETIMVRGS